jgi:hypothetical protein
MKRQIRFGVFETNSSSTHAVAVMTDEEYQKYKKGEVLISRYGDVMTKEEYEAEVKAEKKKLLDKAEDNWNKYYKDRSHYKSIEEYKEALEEEETDTEYNFDTDNMEVEHAEREVGGVKVHAISVYGYDG